MELGNSPAAGDEVVMTGTFGNKWHVWKAKLAMFLLIRHGLLQSPDAVQLEPVEGLRHLSPSKVYE
jgi:hypothetical protein